MSNQLIHISDWLPTFAKLAGVRVRKNIDGINIWNALSNDLPSPRLDLLINVDNDEPYSSFIRGNYKYINGSRYSGFYDTWLSSEYEENTDFKQYYGDHIVNSLTGRAISKFSKGLSRVTVRRAESLRADAKVTCNGRVPAKDGPSVCNPTVSPCLFNIVADPCETTNLAYLLPATLQVMKTESEHYQKIAAKPRNKPSDPLANPGLYNGTWTNWFDVQQIPGIASHFSIELFLPFVICFSKFFI